MSSLHIRPSPRWSLWGTVRIMSNLYDAALTVATTTNFISIIVVSLLFSYVVYRNHIASSRKLPLPPGPKPLPLIGNTFDVPRSFQWSTFMKWAEEYGTWVFLGNVDFIYFSNILQAILFMSLPLGSPWLYSIVSSVHSTCSRTVRRTILTDRSHQCYACKFSPFAMVKVMLNSTTDQDGIGTSR